MLKKHRKVMKFVEFLSKKLLFLVMNHYGLDGFEYSSYFCPIFN